MLLLSCLHNAVTSKKLQHAQLSIILQSQILTISSSIAVQAMMGLSLWQQLLWSLGFKLSHTEMAIRAFNFIDDNGNNSVSINAMETLFQIIQDELPVAKASFDYLEVCHVFHLNSSRCLVMMDLAVGQARTRHFGLFPSSRVQPLPVQIPALIGKALVFDG